MDNIINVGGFKATIDCFGHNIVIPSEYENVKEIEELKQNAMFGKEPEKVTDLTYQYDSVTICLNVTKTCNLNCKYCFNKHKEKKSLSYENAVKFIDIITTKYSTAKRFIVDLAGSGEPLLEMDKVLKIADYCFDKSNQLKCEVLPMLVTNGMLLTKDAADLLSSHHIIFGVSLDSVKKYHDNNRVTIDGKGTYKMIINNVKSIKNREYIGAAVTVSDFDINLVKTVKSLEKYFNTIGIKISRGITKDSNVERLLNSYTELANLLIRDAREGYLDKMICLLNGDDFFGKYLFRVFSNQASPSRCDAGIGKFSLDADLKVYPCSGSVYVKEMNLGTIDSIDFSKGRNIQEKTIDNDVCNNCLYKYICGGECPVLLLTSGVSNEMCRIKKHLINLAFFTKGVMQYSMPKMYERILAFIEIKAMRFTKDERLTNLLDKMNDSISFMDLKHIKDTDMIEFEALEKKYQ